MPKKFPNYKNKKVLIFGLGLLGRGVKDTIFFAERGAKVRVTDLKTAMELSPSLERLKNYKIEYTLGGHKREDIQWADLIIRNAGVPQASPQMKLAQRLKKKVDMDESLFAEYCPCPIIGITGTRGKSTTTVLLGKMLKELFPKINIYVSGNLLEEASLPLIDKVKKDDLVILELSSWQLQGFGAKKISPHIAVFTNIYEDHLNYYKDMKAYIKDKKNIYRFQSKLDYCVINKNNAVKDLAREMKATKVWFSQDDVPQKWKLKLEGEHNKENMAAVIQVGKILGLTEDEMEGPLSAFTGVEHRQELVREINGITFINDTTSTTPTAAEKALTAISGPINLIAGGATKKIELSPLAKIITQKAKTVILLEGSATAELERLIKEAGGEHLIAGKFNNLEEAVRLAYSLSLPGDKILLSPGCASFGMFKNEFDRGEQFKKIVNKL